MVTVMTRLHLTCSVPYSVYLYKDITGSERFRFTDTAKYS